MARATRREKAQRYSALMPASFTSFPHGKVIDLLMRLTRVPVATQAIVDAMKAASR